MSKFVGFIIGGLEIAVGVALLAVPGGQALGMQLIVMGGATVVSQAVVDLTAPKSPAREASEMSIALGEQPRCAQFGETFTPGSLVDAFNYGGKYGTDWEVLVIRLADHKCEGLTGFFVNGDWNPYTGDGLVTRYDDQLEIYFRSDTTNQTLTSRVTTYGPGWTSSDIGASGCDVVVAYKADKPNDKHPGWPGGRPRFGFVIKGKLCYDPRKDSTVPGGSGAHRWATPSTWEWTENCVVCRYNWVRGIYANDDVTDPTALLVGRGLTADEAPPENIFAAANLCDVDAAATKPYQQVATTITSGSELAFGSSYVAHWADAGGQIEWWDIKTRTRLGVSASPGTMTGLLSSVSLARSGTAYCIAPKLPSGHLFYIVTAPLGSPQSTDTGIAATVHTQIDVTRALDTIDGLQVYAAYHDASGYLADTGSGITQVSLTGKSARDFWVDEAGHAWMFSQPTGTSTSYTLTDLKTGTATSFTGAVSRAGPSDGRGSYCSATGTHLVSMDGHFYVIDKALMTVSATGTAAWTSYAAPNNQQNPSRTTFWDGVSEYSAETGSLIRTIAPLSWLASIDSGFQYDGVNDAIWALAGSLLNIRFLDRSGPWKVAGPVYADQPFIDVEEMFAAACAGSIITHEGSVELEPAQAKSVVASFTDADLIVGEQVKWNQGFLSQADAEWLNTVVARYIEPDQKWNDHAAPVLRDTADITADGQPREASLTLRLVRYQAQAMRIAEINRRLGRIWGRASVVLGPRFCEIEDGDWIEWQSDRHFAGATKTFRVDAYSIDEKWRNTLTLREIDASVYADDASFPSDTSIPTTSPPPPDIGAPAGGTWTLTPTTLVSSGASVPVLTVTGVSDDSYAEAIKVEYWKSDGVTDPVANVDTIPWIDAGSYSPTTTSIQLPAPTGGAVYYAAVSYIVSGEQGDRLVIGPQTAGDFAAHLTIEDEGSPLTTSPASINFTGAGVTATAVGTDVTVDVTGGSSTLWYFSPPAVGGFTLVSGDATNATFTADADIGSVLKFNSAGVAGDITRSALESITTPAAAWSYEVRMIGTVWSTNFCGAGLIIRNVSNNRNIQVVLQNDGITKLQYRTMTSFSSNGSTLFNTAAEFASSFLKITYDGAGNLKFYTSAGGKYWRGAWSEPVASYLLAAPDKIGFGIFTNNAGITDDLALSVQRRVKSW